MKKKVVYKTFDKAVFGARVRKLRLKNKAREKKKRKWSQEWLAKEIDENKGATYILNIEKGRDGPSLDSAIMLADILNTSLDYLCNRDDFLSSRTTLGDISRTLAMLRYLDGVTMTSEKIVKESGKESEIVHICVERGELRRFLADYLNRTNSLQARASAKEFITWIEAKMDELDTIPAWDETAENNRKNMVRDITNRNVFGENRRLTDEEIENALLGKPTV